ncbi:MAG: sialidase family protein [Polaromonas sp.]
MNARHRNLLFAGLMLIAFAAAGYKVFSREPASTFAVSATKTSPISSKPDSTGQPSQIQSQFVSSHPGQAVHAPSVVELKDGSLRAVWFSGSREGAGDVTIQTAVFNNHSSQRWGTESSLFDRAQLQRGLWRYVKKIGNPVIARAPDGSLHLWMVNVSLGGWAGSAITWSRSVDDGSTWSTPKRLVTSPFLNISTLVKAAPVAMANGQISLPVYHEFIAKFAEVLRIDASGRVLDKVRIPGSQTSLQPVVLAGSAQTAQALMRATQGGRVMSSTTQDAGQTWSVASPVALPNPNSALAGAVLQDGSRWLALNPTTQGREKLALIRLGDAANKEMLVEPPIQNREMTSPLSREDYATVLGAELKSKGVTDTDIPAYVASAQRQLCTGASCAQEFSYPFLLQSRDGALHLVYTWHRTRIKHVRLDLSAIHSNKAQAHDRPN